MVSELNRCSYGYHFVNRMNRLLFCMIHEILHCMTFNIISLWHMFSIQWIWLLLNRILFLLDKFNSESKGLFQKLIADTILFAETYILWTVLSVHENSSIIFPDSQNPNSLISLDWINHSQNLMMVYLNWSILNHYQIEIWISHVLGFRDEP